MRLAGVFILTALHSCSFTFYIMKSVIYPDHLKQKIRTGSERRDSVTIAY